MKSAKRVAAFLTATALVFSFSPAVFAEDPSGISSGPFERAIERAYERAEENYYEKEVEGLLQVIDASLADTAKTESDMAALLHTGATLGELDEFENLFNYYKELDRRESRNAQTGCQALFQDPIAFLDWSNSARASGTGVW